MSKKEFDTKKLAQEILNEIGGKENIIHMTNCMSRLRFRLKDNTIPDRDKIKSMDGVAGLSEQGGQLQIIIGNKVRAVYGEIAEMVGDIAVVGENGGKAIGKSSQNPVIALMGVISDIFTPVLGVLVACGGLLGIANIITAFNLVSTESAGYTILYAIANAFYYFMPILLGASAAEKFGINRYTGMIIGGAMIHPNIMNQAGTTTHLFFIPLTYQNYTSTMFPVIVTVFCAAVIFKFVDRHCPSFLKLFLPTLISTLLSVTLGLLVIAPAVTVGGNLISSAINALYSLNPVICGLLVTGPWMILVMFGLHWAVIPIMVNNFATVGYDFIYGLLCPAQWAFAAATLAVAVKTRNMKKKQLAYSTGLTCFFGVSEPCIYGVLLPEKKALATAVISTSLASVPVALCGTKGYGFGAAGLFDIPMFLSPNGVDIGFIGALISIVLALVISFTITYFFGVNKEDSQAV